MEIIKSNALIAWVYRTLDLSNITSPHYTLPIQPSKYNPWLFVRFMAAWKSTNDDPSVFVTPSFKIKWAGRNYENPEETVSLSSCINTGLEDLTAATTRPKQFYWPSPFIGWPMAQQDVMEFEVRDFLGAGKPDEIQLLFIGKRIFDKVF